MIAGPDARMQSQLVHTCMSAVTPATSGNHHHQAIDYITFMVAQNFHNQILAPTPLTRVWQTDSKAQCQQKTGAKTYILSQNGDVSVFTSYIIHLVMNGNRRLSSHVPKEAIHAVSHQSRHYNAGLGGGNTSGVRHHHPGVHHVPKTLKLSHNHRCPRPVGTDPCPR